MDCSEVRDEFSALIDGELSADARAHVEAHLSECADCLRALDKMKRVDGLYRSLAPQTAPEGFEERVRASVAIPREVKRHAVRPALRWWPAWVAVAACVAIVVSVGVLRTGARPGRFNVASVETKLSASVPKGIAQENVRSVAKQPVPQAEGVSPPAAASRESVEMDKLADKEQTAETADGAAYDKATVQKEELPAPVAPNPPAADAAKSRVLPMDRPERKREAKPEVPPAPLAVPAPASAPQAPAASIPPPPPPPQVDEARVQERVLTPTQGETKAERAAPMPPPPATPAPAVSRAPEAGKPAPPESPPVPPPASATDLREERVQRNFAALPDSHKPVPKGVKTASAMPDAAPLPAKAKESSAHVGMATQLAAAPEKKDAATAEKKTVAGRTFTLHNGVWQQDGYTPDTRVRTLRRDSQTLETFLKKHPDIKPILDLGDRVIFQCEDKWYRVELKSR